mgnify:CR=1 FL=1
MYRKETPRAKHLDMADYVPMRVKGAVNFLFLILVIVAVLFSEALADFGHAIHFPFVREVIMVILAILSLKLGPRGPRASNHFAWAPIVEVAVLFAGIFVAAASALGGNDLVDLPVRQALQVRGEKEVDRIPADGPGKMPL